MIQAQLELEWASYIIGPGERYTEFTAEATEGKDDCTVSFVAITYPELDLLWLLSFPCIATPEYLNTGKKFIRQWQSLPRWEATRYAVVEGAIICDGRVVVDPAHFGQNASQGLFLFDCRTGQRLVDNKTHKPLPGRAAEVARLRRGIELLMRGEHFSFW